MLDYETIAVSRLVGQFQNSPKLTALMAQIVGPLGPLEGDADAIKGDRWIDTAVGKQLDGCGDIVGEQRRGRNDDQYRIALKFRVFVNISRATPTDLIRGLKFLTDPTDSQYQESYPATALLFTNGYFVDSTIQSAMQDLAPAGVTTVPVAVSFMSAPFRFSKEPVPGELFVNDGNSYLTANGSDIQVTSVDKPKGNATLGGATPSDFIVTGDHYLDVGGSILVAYNPNTAGTLGHDNLTGVFQ